MEASAVFNPVYIGIAAGIFTAASLVPQLVKIIREKKASAVSLGMLVILFAGIVLWIIYGAMIKDLPLITTNSCSLALNVLIIIFSLKYKNRE